MPGLNGARARGSKFGICARRLGARPQLIVRQGVRRPGEDLASLHVGVGRGECLLGADDGEKRAADGVLHGEARQPFFGAGADDPRLRLAHGGAPKAEVDRLPGQQPAGGTAPDTLT